MGYSYGINILTGEKYLTSIEGGASGTSGSSGISGSSGTSGIGISGTSGVSGTSGTSGIGISGTSGTSGKSGSSGVSNNNVINVKEWGAVGDGVTDDTSVLEICMEQGFQTKKPVYFPSGTYMIRRALTLKSNMEIYGNGATIKKFAAVTAVTTLETPENQEYATVNSVTGFTVGSHMYITNDAGSGLGARFATYGIITSIDTVNKRIYFTSLYNSVKVGAVKTHVVGCKVSTSHAIFRSWGTYYECLNTYIHNLTIDGNRQADEPFEWTNSTIHIDANTGTLSGIPYDKAAKDNTFKNLIILNSPCDSISDQCTGGALIDNCYTSNSKNHGYHFGTVYTNGKVTNCSIISVGSAGVFWCQQASEIIVSNNYFESCNKGCSSVEFSTPPANSVISSNIFKNIVSTVCDFSHNGTGYGGMIISNNIIIGLRSEFVKCAYLSGVTITNNQIRTITTNPTYLITANNVFQLVVSGNITPANANYVNSTSSTNVIDVNNSWNT